MQIKSFTELSSEDRALLQDAVSRLPHSLNKVSNPQTSAIALTENGHYYGNNIFLSNCTLFCAEAAAFMASVTANDRKVTKLYLAVGREDKAPEIISPCGNCRQILHDFSSLNGSIIEVFSTTSELKEVMVTNSVELLPEGFKSASLGKMAQNSQ
jgi:cytidine deaminase